jgi:pimeloyl-ACP methyl ester carboxylesterase
VNCQIIIVCILFSVQEVDSDASFSFKTACMNKFQFRTISMSYNRFNGSASKTPLIILHGLFGSKQNWNSLAKQLNRQLQRTVVALDLRNHGESPHTKVHDYESIADDIYEFSKNHGFNKISLIGHSMGGKSCMVTSFKYPKLVEKQCIVDMAPLKQSHTLQDGFGVYFTAMRSVLNNQVESAQQADRILQEFIPDFSIRQFLLTNLKKSDAGGYRFRINLDVLEQSLSKLWDFSILDFGSITPVPSLFIRGSKSNYVPESCFAKIQELFPNSSIESIEAGHWVHSEKPGEFLEKVVPFFQ